MYAEYVELLDTDDEWKGDRGAYEAIKQVVRSRNPRGMHMERSFHLFVSNLSSLCSV